MGVSERKEREKERRREEIITAAEKVFFSKGVDTATMEEVSGEAELSKATLYLYFSSKEELYFAIFLRGQKLMANFINKAIGLETDTRKKMYAYASSIMAFQKKYANYFEAFFYFLTHDVTLAQDSFAIKKHKETSKALLENWIILVQTGKQEGIINENLDENEDRGNPVDAADRIPEDLYGFKKDMKSKFNFSDQNMIEDYTEMIFNGVLKK